MKRLLLLPEFCLGLGACAGTQYRDTSVALAPVASVDLTRYAGTWYEIARFPNDFERGCYGTTDEYTLRTDGAVEVVNTCREGALDGPVRTAEGVARPVDDSNARLKVRFVPWLPFAGDYWILYLDPDYRTAVGTPDGDTGWILARTPTIADERLETAMQALSGAGYHVSKLYDVPQPPG